MTTTKVPEKVVQVVAKPEIIKCECEHPFQDHKYGKYNRVMNPMRTGGYRCTVCGAKKSSTGYTINESKKK